MLLQAHVRALRRTSAVREGCYCGTLDATKALLGAKFGAKACGLCVLEDGAESPASEGSVQVCSILLDASSSRIRLKQPPVAAGRSRILQGYGFTQIVLHDGQLITSTLEAHRQISAHSRQGACIHPAMSQVPQCV